jgi:dynamin 1/3
MHYLVTTWRAEAESLKNILTGSPQNKLGRIALVDTIAKQIHGFNESAGS